MAAKKTEKKANVLKAADLRKLSAEELRSKLAEEREALMTARFKHATAQLEKTSELKATRRLVARISTVLNEKD
ncbi:50S ribosomal protein L29 [uncultured Desulfovibrio sp.]|uniref:50S ribosomal protein L29 n=1 Tax=uncultured Desulfovibrio sp. TaxID=167968 RepID=UPI00263131F6|nr:50S ribosomal protein L29 [uncultured Desulfovibrio sp.]